MQLSERKAREAFMPWWDVWHKYSTVATLAIWFALYHALTSSKGTSELVMQESGVGGSSSTNDDGYATGSSNSSSRSSSNNNGNGDIAITDHLRQLSSDGGDDLKEGSPITLKTLARSGKYHETPVVLTLCGLCLATALIIADWSFSKLFYNFHLVQLCCHLLEHLSDLGSGGVQGHGLLFVCTLHHTTDKTSLRRLFVGYNWMRMVTVVTGLVVAANAFAVIGEEEDPVANAVYHVLVGFLLLLQSLQTLTLLYASSWPWIYGGSLWGRLMDTYANTTDKLDVVRGRTVPVPPFKHPARVMESLNPYVSNSNLHLLLDLVALRRGVGVALRCLASLEADVASHWRPFKLEVSKDESDPTSLIVSWTNPLAVLYLTPVPPELSLHYGLEVVYGAGLTQLWVVGYEDARYHRQMWRAAEPGGVDLGNVEQPMAYNEVFQNFFADEEDENSCVSVTVWTMVDGQLIAKSSVIFQGKQQVVPDNLGEMNTANVVPKPPRANFSSLHPSASFREGLNIVVTAPSRQLSMKSEAEKQQTQKQLLSVSRAQKQIIITPAASSTFSLSEQDDPEEASEANEEKTRCKSLSDLRSKVCKAVEDRRSRRKKCSSEGSLSGSRRQVEGVDNAAFVLETSSGSDVVF